MKALILPRLIGDGMVLQQKKKVRIWGEDEAGRKITLFFLDKEYRGVAGGDGIWELFLQEMEPGGPYSMCIRDDAGEEITVRDILIGDVWMCSGQSNMELPMRRVIDRYPQELERCGMTQSLLPVRTFKITEKSDFHGPLNDLASGEWTALAEDTLLDFSATAYFFAKHLYRISGVPVGLINASLGGSRIESLMDRDMLAGYDDFMALADRYGDDAFVAERLEQNARQAAAWHSRLDEMDLGLREDWARENAAGNVFGNAAGKAETAEVSAWQDVEIPFFFQDTALKGLIGSVWFRREFTVGKERAGKEAKLWLGTIVDSDTVYINGVCVGHTDYQYPPRKYVVPSGLLREGQNSIVIRVKSETGQGRFTDGKTYALLFEEEKIDLSGVWEYRVGAVCEMIGETDFVNWKPTGLYHAMMAPCHRYTIAGILWYQGESNTHAFASRYLDLMERMIMGYRKKWAEELPFFYVQLPNFSAEVYEKDRHALYSDWPGIREAQRKALKIPGTGMAVAIDLGEDNDLHPLNKDGIGYRLAMQAAAALYGTGAECSGPQICGIGMEGGSRQVRLRFRYAEGMYAHSEDKGMEIKDFEIMDGEGRLYPVKAVIAGNDVILTREEGTNQILEIRYCYRNTNRGALLYNKGGFPMSPFRLGQREILALAGMEDSNERKI
ncbi:MAG: sialate O-acetylesterase [Lachnospiraceae bacterium]|nr:sialate O-acetylesterase [Lachnospiraceae bacterium]